ncbi:MAG: sulfatase-like hydrolase/transferase, partial [Pirellulaceae bacterium]|nr:sulfatase-like hydrolase/transferase [Pirellulaceae bacterium]
IEKNRERPFFLYLAHPIPHTPLHVSPPYMKDVPPEVKEKLTKEDGFIDYGTRKKLFRQAIAEVDWSVGQIVAALKQHDLDRDTLVIFTSDNGPAVGSAGPLRGRKGSTFEGGMREPTVAWWPGKIPSGRVCNELLTSMDLMPTFANLAGAPIPDDRVIDGKDIWPVLAGRPGAKSPHDRFFYHAQNSLRAVRSGPWKLHLAKSDSQGSSTTPAALYHLDTDIGETRDVAAEQPEIVERLQGYADAFEEDLRANSRSAAFVDEAKPLVPHETNPG